jgi:copper homeostasis protein|tara:strand:+ start:2859 stop:3584 length:726 start_codon:yes stop_codon:yes gene_type:complete
MAVPFEIEIAVEEATHATLLKEWGVDRIELCANLAEGGLTPTFGQSLEVVRATELPVYVMLRARAGDFQYSTSEKRQMLADLERLATSGIQGVVFGALNPNKTVDQDFCDSLINRAKKLGLGTTFHRAFDACVNPEKAIEFLINRGVDRILTSGFQPSVQQGMHGIAQTLAQAKGRISIQAGAGVNAAIASELWRTGIRAFHATARYWEQEEQRLGFEGRWMPDEEKIKALRHEVDRCSKI